MYTYVHTKKPVSRVLVKILAAVPSLTRLAKDSGVSVRAIRAYRYGKRTPEAPQVLQGLVRGLRRQSRELTRMADELERAAAQPPPRRRRA